MDKNLKREYKKEIREIKKQNLETLRLIFKYSLENMVESVDNIEQSVQLLEEVNAITIEEKRLLNYIKRNLKKIDENELDRVLDSLDQINEETIEYYYYILDNIGTDMSIEKIYRQLQTLTDTEKYRKEVYGLTLNMKDIVKYLDYSASFWSYILPRTTRTDNEEFYQINIKCDKQETIKDIRVFVPHITSLETAKINIHEFKHAHDIYNMLGFPYVEKDYESIARTEEKQFENKYVNQKVKRYFG